MHGNFLHRHWMLSGFSTGEFVCCQTGNFFFLHSLRCKELNEWFCKNENKKCRVKGSGSIDSKSSAYVLANAWEGFLLCANANTFRVHTSSCWQIFPYFHISSDLANQMSSPFCAVLSSVHRAATREDHDEGLKVIWRKEGKMRLFEFIFSSIVCCSSSPRSSL